MQVLGAILDEPIIDNPCDGTGGTSGTGGVGGRGGFAGVGGTGIAGDFGMGGAFAGRGGGGRMGTAGSIATGGTSVGGMGGSGGAPIIDIELPSADEPVEELDERDGEIREAYGERTLSGRSAQSTH